ncbi:hypothetical protein [Paenibacillus algorifonticola]|uniref:hypothetical protein n=1 Tax=Paenibacillus algorifonticola TaxID=684063 RepID=UPI0015A66686|nr:hypothetical protein [Paenibacillus algorifonticola]
MGLRGLQGCTLAWGACCAFGSGRVFFLLGCVGLPGGRQEVRFFFCWYYLWSFYVVWLPMFVFCFLSDLGFLWFGFLMLVRLFFVFFFFFFVFWVMVVALYFLSARGRRFCGAFGVSWFFVLFVFLAWAFFAMVVVMGLFLFGVFLVCFCLLGSELSFSLFILVVDSFKLEIRFCLNRVFFLYCYSHCGSSFPVL